MHDPRRVNGKNGRKWRVLLAGGEGFFFFGFGFCVFLNIVFYHVKRNKCRVKAIFVTEWRKKYYPAEYIMFGKGLRLVIVEVIYSQ